MNEVHGVNNINIQTLLDAISGIAESISDSVCLLSARLSGLCACVSITLAHPDKAAGRYEMPFGRDTCVVPSKLALDRGPGSPQKATGTEDLGSKPAVRSELL